jgi:signal transduction histidine kinase
VAGTLPSAPAIRLSPSVRSIPLQADAVRLEQVFVNLLSNAVEHAASSPTIEVTVSRSGAMAVVEICDHGPGIAADLMPLLFRPYARLGQKKSGGLGLGLYLAREIVTAHGGTIEAQSSVGEGTTITVRLPIRKATVGAGGRPKKETAE